MAQLKTIVEGREEVKDTYVKKTGRFLIFKTTWYEKVSTEHIGNDIVIEDERPIRQIFFNGKPLLTNK